ncbi:MAG: SRPBCC domain-containing protein [Steroidobacteraceae bacterium]
MKMTVETAVNAKLNTVWDVWNNPEDIKQWNAPQDDWHTTTSAVDLREGGKFKARMEAKDGSEGFDFEGVYTRVVPKKLIEYRMSDGREVMIEFVERPEGVLVKETFDTENTYTPEQQREGWQNILDNFGRHVEAKRSTA